MFNELLSSLTGLGSAKDSILSNLLNPFVQEHLGEAATLQDIKLDSVAKTIELTAALKGDPKPLVVRITKYSLQNQGQTTGFSVESWECQSHPWLHLLGQRFASNPTIPLPIPYVMAKMVL